MTHNKNETLRGVSVVIFSNHQLSQLGRLLMKHHGISMREFTPSSFPVFLEFIRPCIDEKTLVGVVRPRTSPGNLLVNDGVIRQLGLIRSYAL